MSARDYSDPQLDAIATGLQAGEPIEKVLAGLPRPKVRFKNNNEESRSQKAVIKWFQFACKGFGVPEIMLFAIPYGVRRSVISGAILKAEGMRVGCPDLFLAVPRGICSQLTTSSTERLLSYKTPGLFLEMKTATGRVSPEQEVYHGLLEKHGYRVAVCRSSEEAIQRITNYLKS